MAYVRHVASRTSLRWGVSKQVRVMENCKKPPGRSPGTPRPARGRFQGLGSEVFFGQNLIHDETGVLNVVDAVQVIELRPA